jgi:hypothetical protein
MGCLVASNRAARSEAWASSRCAWACIGGPSGRPQKVEGAISTRGLWRSRLAFPATFQVRRTPRRRRPPGAPASIPPGRLGGMSSVLCTSPRPPARSTPAPSSHQVCWPCAASPVVCSLTPEYLSDDADVTPVTPELGLRWAGGHHPPGRGRRRDGASDDRHRGLRTGVGARLMALAESQADRLQLSESALHQRSYDREPGLLPAARVHRDSSGRAGRISARLLPQPPH